MKRRALIIYCDNTESGELEATLIDNDIYRSFLQNKIGGDWKDSEIKSLRNPNSLLVMRTVSEFLNGADYTFTIFTGHGYINLDDRGRQYIELSDKSISIINLRTTARRQTLIVDACRGYFSRTTEILKSFSESWEHDIGDMHSTRQLFDEAVLRAEEGWTILYAAKENETALATDEGSAYLFSLVKVAESWETQDKKTHILDVKVAHIRAKAYLLDNFETIQEPVTNIEKRLTHFPFAVKFLPIYG